MAEVRPFCGVRFDPAAAGSPFGRLIAPPYDVVSSPDLTSLLDRSPYNAVRLELPIEHPGDAPDYAAAARRFHDWLAAGVLRRQNAPAVYVHEHEFDLAGSRHRRLGVVVAVRLEPWEAGVVLPHERTMPGPIRDRLNLLRALPVNVSPIFGLYRDPDGSAAAALATITARPPDDEFDDPTGDGHRVWVETDATVHAALAASLRDGPIFVADGHHRYETALAYRDERRAVGETSPDAPAEFIMMTLVDMADPGLSVLAIHRVLHRVERPAEAALAGLRRRFAVEPLFLGERGVAGVLARLATAGEDSTALGLVLPGGEAWLLRRPFREGDLLDAVVAREEVIEGAFGIGESALEEAVRFTRDANEAVAAVQNGAAAAAVLLNPVRLDQLAAEAVAGRRLPQKTSYFFPKVPTGIAFRELDAGGP